MCDDVLYTEKQHSSHRTYNLFPLQTAVDLLALADRYGFGALSQSIERKLCAIIHHTNVLQLLFHSQVYNAHNLNQACLNFVDTNAELVLAGKGEHLKSIAFMSLWGKRGEQSTRGLGVNTRPLLLGGILQAPLHRRTATHALSLLPSCHGGGGGGASWKKFTSIGMPSSLYKGDVLMVAKLLPFSGNSTNFLVTQ